LGTSYDPFELPTFILKGENGKKYLLFYSISEGSSSIEFDPIRDSRKNFSLGRQYTNEELDKIEFIEGSAIMKEEFREPLLRFNRSVTDKGLTHAQVADLTKQVLSALGDSYKEITLSNGVTLELKKDPKYSGRFIISKKYSNDSIEIFVKLSPNQIRVDETWLEGTIGLIKNYGYYGIFKYDLWDFLRVVTR